MQSDPQTGAIESKRDFRRELARLEALLEELKIEYEQYFIGVLPHAPDKKHKMTKRFIRDLMRAPFKSSEISYRLTGLERRYQTYNTYWERVKRQREEGTYKRDLFKASMRERHAMEDQQSSTQQGQANKAMKNLFDSYKSAVQKQAGAAKDLDYESFKRSMSKRAKEIKEKTGAKKLSFKVVVRNGKVSLQAKAKE